MISSSVCQRLDGAPAIIELRRHRMLADRDPRARGVEQAHRFVGQLPSRDVAVRQPHRRLERFIEHLNAMMLLEHGRDPSHHQDGLLFAGLGDLYDLEASRECRVLLDVLLVFGPGRGRDRSQRTARQCRLQQVGRVTGSRRTSRTDQRMRFVYEQDDRLRGSLHFVDHLPQAVLELTLHAGAGLQQSDVERVERHLLERRRHIAARQPQREALDDSRLTDASLARQNGIVLPSPHQDVDDLPNLFVPPGDGIDLALARPVCQVGRVSLERLLLPHLGRRHRPAGLSGRRHRRAVCRRQPVFRRSFDDAAELLGQGVGLDRLELTRDRHQRIAQRRRLDHAHDKMAGPNLGVPEHQRGIDPAALDRVLDVR